MSISCRLQAFATVLVCHSQPYHLTINSEHLLYHIHIPRRILFSFYTFFSDASGIRFAGGGISENKEHNQHSYEERP